MFRWLAKLTQRSSANAGTAQPRAEHQSAATDGSEFVYELPFSPGPSFQVMQGYGGTYSHTETSYYSLDFRMPERTAIHASRSGLVYRVVDHFADGGTHPSFKPKSNTIHILHVDDTLASYVHLVHGGSLVRPGEFVRAGQHIGFSGNTGWSGSPHLHFHVCDVVTRERVPTLFKTTRSESEILTQPHWYTRPHADDVVTTSRHRAPNPTNNVERDPFAFSAELLQHQGRFRALLDAQGYDHSTDYSSVDTLQDVHGLEVCGITSGTTALQITRLLLGEFPGWNAGWLHEPSYGSQQKWVASIQRDRDLTPEYWDTD